MKFKGIYRIPSARMPQYDYNGGVFFITICTAERMRAFGTIENNEMCLSDLGKWAEMCLQQMEALHNDVSVPLFVVMPDHVHIVVCIDTPVETPQCDVSNQRIAPNHIVEPPQCDVSNERNEQNVGANETPQCDVSTEKTVNVEMQRVAQRCGRLSHLIGQYKSAVTRYARENGWDFAWQTRFYDRIVRDQNELNAVATYIENNVNNWANDASKM